VAIIAAGLLVYINSFQGPFLFDDLDIIANLDIRELWPPWRAMLAPQNVSRPLIGLSLAINYAISGLDVWSYHALNLLIHVLAALTLFGITRRTLLTGPLRERFGQASTALALVVALVWMVHPLQTQSVTYIIQRCESQMGLFYLLTLYCAIRSFDAERKGLWQAAALASCAAGMMSKQVMLTAPLMVLIYDWLFFSSSLRRALFERRRLYIGLALTWGVLAATLMAAPVNQTAGFAVKSITPLSYLKSQFGVVAHYLRLSLWPDSLVLDYAWPEAKTAGEVVPYAVILIWLASASLWALLKRMPVGFLGAWFFLIISLTSSIMPFSDLAYEHRMYLPLAAVVGLVVLGGYALGGRLLPRLVSSEPLQKRWGRLAALSLVAAVTAMLGFLTLQRNLDYQSPIAMWSDVVRKRPENARGHTNLGKFLAERGYLDEALLHFSEACKYNPDSPSAHNNLGQALVTMGNYEEGKIHLKEALRLRPNYAFAHYNLGQALSALGELDEAAAHFSQTLRSDPNHAEAYFNLGLTREKQGDMSEAVNCYRAALRLAPHWPDALNRLDHAEKSLRFR